MLESRTKTLTTDRLIEAAGELFATKGFEGTTVKEITDLAGANLAAIHYHFGDKKEMYETVIMKACSEIREKFPLDRGFDEASTPGERLRNFVRNMLYRFMDPARPAWQGVLFSQEMSNPSPVVCSMMEEEAQRIRALLDTIIRDLLGAEAEAEQVHLCMKSIMGQIRLQIPTTGPRPSPFSYGKNVTAEGIEKIADHITDFSLGGIGRKRAKMEDAKIDMVLAKKP